MQSDDTRQSLLSGHGSILVAGLALAAVGLAIPPQQGGTQDPPQPPPPEIVTTLPAIANADSNSRMIAVTGIDLTGSSVLFVIDTVDPHLAVYQASGGVDRTQGIKFVGARRIDLDLKLDGWNDRSQIKYKELEQEFSEQGLLPADRGAAAKTTAEPPVKRD